jgi:hypothetical protein
MEKVLAGYVKELHAVDLALHYIGHTSASGELSSMYGPDDVAGDLFQVCARSRTSAWLDVILCQNDDPEHIATNWPACAETEGVSSAIIADVKSCAEGAEGKQLLTQSFAASAEMGVRASPTLRIEGVEYRGSRRGLAIERSICAAYQGAPPSACASIPPAPNVDVIILTDTRCPECAERRLEEKARQAFEAPTISTLDYTEPAGKALFTRIAPAHLPLIVVDQAAETTPEFPGQLKSPLVRKVGDLAVLEGGTWNPECADAGGCATPACSDTTACAPETTGKLDLYMMGRCPFAAKAILATKYVLADLEKKGTNIDLSIHFIGRVNADGSLYSMHGADEVAEDLRDVCAIAHWPRNRKYLEYLSCRAADTTSNDWQACVGGRTGFDEATLRRCSEGAEGKALLKKSFERSERVGIAASPTWVTMGRYDFKGNTTSEIEAGVCAHDRLPACAARASSSTKP